MKLNAIAAAFFAIMLAVPYGADSAPERAAAAPPEPVYELRGAVPNDAAGGEPIGETPGFTRLMAIPNEIE